MRMVTIAEDLIQEWKLHIDQLKHELNTVTADRDGLRRTMSNQGQIIGELQSLRDKLSRQIKMEAWRSEGARTWKTRHDELKDELSAEKSKHGKALFCLDQAWDDMQKLEAENEKLKFEWAHDSVAFDVSESKVRELEDDNAKLKAMVRQAMRERDYYEKLFDDQVERHNEMVWFNKDIFEDSHILDDYKELVEIEDQP